MFCARDDYPSKCNQKIQKGYNEEFYKQCHLIENAFLCLKRWRGISTCYAKIGSSLSATIYIHDCFQFITTRSMTR